MAEHQMDCDVCRQIGLIERGEHPRFVAELATGYVVLGPHQFWRGYCVLLCKLPLTELSELCPDFRREFLEDMARVAAAIEKVCQPNKMNYESLGNQCPHLHWHLFPRTLEEPNRLDPIWITGAEILQAHAYNPALHDDLRRALTAELG